MLQLALGGGLLLAGARAARLWAEGPPFRVGLPLVEVPPEPTATATLEPSPTAEPTASPTASPTAPAGPPANDAGWIIHPASGTAAQAIAWLVARSNSYTRFDISSIVGVYVELGTSAELDWFLALAQCAHETGSLTSWWCQRPRRNPAGIGVTGQVRAMPFDQPPGPDWAWDGAQWREGVSFAAWAEESAPAHLGRLLAYALPEGAGTPAQRALIDNALRRRGLPPALRGSAQRYTDLNGRWAYPGTEYGQRILDLARRMRAGD